MNSTALRQNLDLLIQGRDVLAGLDPAHYKARGTRKGAAAGAAAVGEHMRHVLDFYRCLLRDLPHGRVDYNDRPRDSGVEADLDRARRELDDVVSELQRLERETGDRPLRVAPDGASVGASDALASSSLERELQFLVSHTVHHYAVIALLLTNAHHPVPDSFGVAPSTLRHRQESGSRAS